MFVERIKDKKWCMLCVDCPKDCSTNWQETKEQALKEWQKHESKNST
jgi:hypothetical protein